VGLLFAAAYAPALAEAADTYKVDTVHSTVLFRVSHLGASNSYGRFNDITGTLTLGDAGGSVDLQVKAESIDTANEKRDQHLKGPDFFAVKQFPLIQFKGDQVKKTAADAYEIAGKLTLHGVTRDVTVKATKVGSAKDPQGDVRTGFECKFKIKRSDFGMTYMVGPIGDEVELIVSLECLAG
jgi:polyisoprenoid-binding protein YceI